MSVPAGIGRRRPAAPPSPPPSPSSAPGRAMNRPAPPSSMPGTNGRVVVIPRGMPGTVVLERLRITGCNIPGSGAGISHLGARLQLRDCIGDG